jgi:hypothetical protein
MIWVRVLAYITGTVDQELLLRNEYLAVENRILRAQIKGRLLGLAYHGLPTTRGARLSLHTPVHSRGPFRSPS